MSETFFEEQSEQSQIKAAIVTKYFWAWAKIITGYLKGAKKDTSIQYIDLFAGPGRYKDGAKSTPVLILEQAIQDPVFREGLDKDPEEDPSAATGHYISVYVNPSLTWDDLPFLRERTSLPIILKGLQHPDDAARALDAGVDGIVVSNHGGRQVDGAIPSLQALPGIVAQVKDRVPVLFDSGIRGGADA